MLQQNDQKLVDVILLQLTLISGIHVHDLQYWATGTVAIQKAFDGLRYDYFFFVNRLREGL